MNAFPKNIFGFVFLIFSLILLSGCFDSDHGSVKTSINGSFSAFPEKMVVLSEFEVNSAIPLDTTRTNENGNFSFRFKRKCPGFYLIKVDNKNYIILSLDKEKVVTIESDDENLKKNYVVSGSPESEALREFEITLEINRSKVDSLTRSYRNNQRSASFSSLKSNLDRTYNEIFEIQRQNSIEFIRNNCRSLVSLLVINKRFGERKIVTEEADFEIYQMLDSCLSSKYPENKFVKELSKQLDIFSDARKVAEMTEKRLDIGKKIPDITLQDPSGRDISLHSFAGRPVLLYFWASWDKASRNTNAKIKAMNEKNGRGMAAVFAIGFESNRNDWQGAIDKDGLHSWTHVSDLNNILSSARSLYNVPENLPYFILLDKDMLILFKGNDISELQQIFDLMVK
jgi:peroxiredoxin